MIKTLATNKKPIVSSEGEKRASPRPRLGLRYGASLDSSGGSGATG